MDILQVLFGESEIILFLMSVVFLKLKCEIFTFQLLPIKLLVNLKGLFLSFPHSSIFVE